MIALTNEQEAELMVTFTSLSGKTAKVDGAPVWSSSNEDIATVTPSADGMMAIIRSVDDAVGEAEIGMVADADLGDGVEELMLSTTVMVRAAQAGVAAFSEPTVRQKT